ncbi:MAG: hypothetical protein ACOC00_03965, partial [Halothiobacillaceae bacterium]
LWTGLVQAEPAVEVWNDQRVVGGQLQAESRFLRESGTSRVSALRKHVALVGPDIDARHDIVGTRRAVGRMQEQLARALASRDAVHFSDLRAVNLHDTSYHDGLDNPYRFLWNDRAIQFAVRLHVREELVSGGADAMMRNLVFTERAAPNSDLLLYLELIDTSSGRLVERVAERRLSLQELLSEGAPDAAVSEDVVEEAAGAGLKREVDRLADHLVGVLSGLPFQARIIDVDSDRGYVNIGFEAGLQPGDKLVLYGTGREVRHYTSEGVQVLGRDESIKGSFRLDSVQTRFARGHVEGRGSPEIGDIVREW